MVNKKKLKRFSEEIVRCELILQDENATEETKKQAENKISMIFKVFERDFENLTRILVEAEKILISKNV